MDLFGETTRPDAAVTGQVKQWVRETLGLDEETVVMVTELRCTEPGCPPLETGIAILEGPGKKRQFKLHKGMAEILPEDLRPLKS